MERVSLVTQEKETMNNDHKTTPFQHAESIWREASRNLPGCTDSKGAPVGSLTHDDVLTMDEATFGALAMVAMSGAAKGRLVSSDPVPRDAYEDSDCALDAVERIWSDIKDGKRFNSIPGRLWWFAHNLGEVRAQHRIREKGSTLIEEATDKKVDERFSVVWTAWNERGEGTKHRAATWAEIGEQAKPGLRARLQAICVRWKDRADHNAVRDARRALGVSAPPSAPVLAKPETRREITDAEIARAIAQAQIEACAH